MFRFILTFCLVTGTGVFSHGDRCLGIPRCLSPRLQVPMTIVTNVSRSWGISDVFSTLSIARQFVGSFSFNSYTAQDGKHLLNIIYDTKNIRSLFYHIIGTDYLNHSRNSFFKPLSNTYQFYIWKSKK